jgi:cytochrome c peroxidase
MEQSSVTYQIRNGATCGAVFVALATFLPAQQSQSVIPNLAGFRNPAGTVRTFNQNGDIDLNSAFFQNLGTNRRNCATCHQPSDAMSISAAHVQNRFDDSDGLDPIFLPNDGSNCDHDIDVSTLAGRAGAYSLLRTRGLIRVALAGPANRDFEVVSVQNPYGCGETAPLSLYRRPLPATNLRFLSAVMWDGRESSSQTATAPVTSATYPWSLLADLAHQTVNATLGHAQALAAPTADQLDQIVNFELALSTAQAEDDAAGILSAEGAKGGPEALVWEPFHVGINDPVGLDPANPLPFSFNGTIFNVFDAWRTTTDSNRQAIYRGQVIFNTKMFTVWGVDGLNDNTFSNGTKIPDPFISTCGLCHNTPNLGNHSLSVPMNIGVADPLGGRFNRLDTSYLPVITICKKPALEQCVDTTDPGRALVTGKFADVSKFKSPVLRGLAARAPYFHNGSAQSLMDVVNFYDSRFSIGFTAQEKSDLVAFLNSL